MSSTIESADSLEKLTALLVVPPPRCYLLLDSTHSIRTCNKARTFGPAIDAKSPASATHKNSASNRLPEQILMTISNGSTAANVVALMK